LDRVRGGGRDTADAELRDALRVHGQRNRIYLVQEDQVLMRNVDMHEHLLHAEVHGVMKSPKRLSTANSAINAALTPIVTAPITWLRGLPV
jgi:hypothetical protein